MVRTSTKDGRQLWMLMGTPAEFAEMAGLDCVNDPNETLGNLKDIWPITEVHDVDL